ncbi:restriction endonuclease subunit S [Desulfovibrio sp. TomC]|uniref:restriction endonuclease subunit S n=1 Tax=Desulfovibrio sp. TomC TaxID=1562888 RepID=UPI0005746079|nr:restriction endonuclease subunit S [Desulfovibrio sp. TomC]KHK03914.1 Type I restriction-modification system, specificity subunit S [Desulfovibrio sp. TomC]
MRYGLTEQTIQLINSVFEKHPVVKQAVLYGSRAKGNYKPGSDIDLSLFGEDISQREVNQILDELDALDLPYTIDLTVFRDITYAKFRDHIARIGVVFYQRDEDNISGEFVESSGQDSCDESVKLGFSGEIKGCFVASWPIVSMGDVCIINPPKKEAKKKLQDSDSVSFVPMNSLGIYTKDLILGSEKALADAYKSYTYFADHDVLLAKITPCFENGKVGVARGLTNGIGFGSSEYIVLRSKSDVLPEYIFYYLSQKIIRTIGARIMTGAVGHKRIPEEFIANLQILLPSITEQKRIVAILDDAFERIDAAIANTEKNIANARELFESYLTDAFFRAGSAWKTCRLGEICKLQNGFVFKSNLFKQSGMPVLRISSIQDELVCDNRPVFADPKDYKEDLRKYEVNDGDLLIAMSGATTGKVGFNRTGQTYLLNQRVGRFVPKIGLSIDYLFLFLLTKQEESLKISAGSAQPNLSTKQINDFTLPFPRLDEQIVFVDKSLAVRESILSIAEVCQSKLSALNELKQSLLQKAFSGELPTDFNPDALEH